MNNTYTVLETSDYTVFQPLPHNRRIVENHVRDLVQSMEERPHLRPARPILLNEQMQIIDGQHRVEASRRLKITVFYMVVPGLTIADARLLNALQRTWSLLDYAESYASDGHKEYVKFMERHEQYKMPASALASYMTARLDDRMRMKFKTGQFKTAEDKIINDYLAKLEDFSQYTKRWNEERFAMAVFHLITNDKYDHRRMLSKLENTRIVPQPSRLEYLRELEDIYNTDLPLKSRVRFFG